MKSPRHTRYRRHRFAVEVIAQAVWLFFHLPRNSMTAIAYRISRSAVMKTWNEMAGVAA